MLNRAQNALNNVGKQLDKSEKKVLKNDIADLKRRLAKNHAELTEEELKGIVASTEKLKYFSEKARYLVGDHEE